jgi:hypothetical protein
VKKKEGRKEGGEAQGKKKERRGMERERKNGAGLFLSLSLLLVPVPLAENKIHTQTFVCERVDANGGIQRLG